MGKPICLFLFLLLQPRPIWGADIYIGLGSEGGVEGKIPIGLAPFLPERLSKPADTKTARELEDIVRADILFSRYFRVIQSGPRVPGSSEKEFFRGWRTVGATHLIKAKASDLGKKFTLRIKLVDLNTESALLEKYYKQRKENLRSAAHSFSNLMVFKLTGKMGIAHTRIAFSNNQTGHKEIYVIDYDGARPTKLTNHKSISLLPCWSPDSSKILYTSHARRNPDLYSLDLKKMKTKTISSFPGLNIAGGFSPDGKQLVLTLAMRKSPNIYLMEPGQNQPPIRRLTFHFGIDSSPTFSPDGRQIAFVSDRSGNPQVYIVEIETGRRQRLTNLNWCDSPSWSPTGEWIAFSGRAKSRHPMDIFLVDLTGSQLVRLTHHLGSNEDPSWSPDGKFLAFSSTRSGRREIYVMDADGSAPHKPADIPGNSNTPSWSP